MSIEVDGEVKGEEEESREKVDGEDVKGKR